MTKDLAILISSDQKWLNTQDFLEALKVNLEEILRIFGLRLKRDYRLMIARVVFGHIPLIMCCN